jgi:hypothetical protein
LKTILNDFQSKLIIFRSYSKGCDIRKVHCPKEEVEEEEVEEDEDYDIEDTFLVWVHP